jgi:hypothetical protein
MIARALLVSIALGLAACGQAQSPAIDSGRSSPGDEAPGAADLLANEPLAGAWESVGDGATTGVRFTPTSNPNTLTIGCNSGTGRAFMNWTLGDPTEDGDVRVFTAAETVSFAAMGTNDGAHMLGVDVDGADPRWAVLKAQQERFAVQGLGQSIVVPWDTSIAAALNECAG